VAELVDPGWREALPAMIPLFGRVVASRPRPQIVVMRALWLSFASAIVWIGVVTVLLTSSSDGTGSALIGFATVVGATVITVGGTLWSRRRRDRLDPHRDDASAYRTSFFIAVAFGELPALVGFAFALVQGRPATYFMGAAITLLAFAFAAPTRRFLTHQGPALRAAMLTPPKR
jgi:hypothetical protein